MGMFGQRICQGEIREADRKRSVFLLRFCLCGVCRENPVPAPLGDNPDPAPLVSLLPQNGARPDLVALSKTVRDFDDAITIHSFGEREKD